jgi:hypothetical protein
MADPTNKSSDSGEQTDQQNTVSLKDVIAQLLREQREQAALLRELDRRIRVVEVEVGRG